MVFDGDRPSAHDGVGIGLCMRAARHRNGAEVFALRAVQVHVSPRRQRHHLGRREQSVRFEVGAHARCAPADRSAAETRCAAAGSLVHGPKRDHAIGHAGRHGHRPQQDRTDRPAAPAVRRLAIEPQRGNPEIGRNIDRVVVVHRELGDPVDVARRESGVFDRIPNGLDRQTHLAAARILRVFGMPDAHDGGLVLQRCRIHAGLLAWGGD